MYSHIKSETPLTDQCFNFRKIEYDVRVRKQNTYNFFHRDRGIRKYYVGQPWLFSNDGSLRVDPDFFKLTAPDYFKKSRRTTLYKNTIHLRGTRYTISSNPTFELRQKLSSLSEDFYEGIEALRNDMDEAYQVGIADYVKNSALTVYNSFLYGEKIGRYRFDQLIYQRLRLRGAKLMESVMLLFYGLLTGHRKKSHQGFEQLEKNLQTFEQLLKRIITSYEEGIFSSRHMTRPEAAHPIIIAGAASLYAEFSKFTPDLIVGMPSGSTELAYAHALAQNIMRGRSVPVLLFPVSLHSVKHDFDTQSPTDEVRAVFAKRNKELIRGRSVLVVDDNSSTGKTIDCVIRAISNCSPSNIDVAVAEADTVRSQLDMTNQDRKRIANVSTYDYSLNILPVSKKINPKNDLKELMETRKVISCIKARYFGPKAPLQKQLIGTVYIDLLQNRTEKALEKQQLEGVISNFRHTFLSNFAPVGIIYNDRQFHSVEHAYQSMKFEGDELSQISSKHFNQINRKLKTRKTKITQEELPNLFVDPNISAGTSKVVGNQLRILGYVRKDWDHAKLHIMAELLIQKFAKDEFYSQLKETNNQYLIEGNDWGDTYWGMDKNRGRNVLGRLLMAIRDLEQPIIKKGAKNIILEAASN